MRQVGELFPYLTSDTVADCETALMEPVVKLRRHCVNRSSLWVLMPLDEKSLISLPTLHCRNAASQVNRDLLPSAEDLHALHRYAAFRVLNSLPKR